MLFRSLGTYFKTDEIPFFPYFIIKDGLSVLALAAIFMYFVGFLPNYLGHPDNYIMANPDSTPEHIVPEWYFLPFYAILRSIPDKLLGVFALLCSILALALLPFFHPASIRQSNFKPITGVLTLIFVSNCIILGYIGQCPLEGPYFSFGQLSTICFFAYFFIIGLINYVEDVIYHLFRWVVYDSRKRKVKN